MRLAVTGGGGFVGRFIVAEALAAGDAVTVLGRAPPAPGLFAATPEFLPFELAEAPPPLAGFDAVVHAAFDHLPGLYRGGEGDDAPGFLRRNLDGSVRLFEAARKASVPRLVFLSSRAVYDGYPPGTRLDETMPLQPDTAYGRAKALAEEALAALSGPGFRGSHKWSAMFRDALAGHAPAPRVATEVHGADLAAAVRLVLRGRADGFDAVNLSDLVLDRRDLLGLLAAATLRPVALPLRAEGAAVSAMDTARARMIGWRPGGWPLLRATLPLLAEG